MADRDLKIQGTKVGLDVNQVSIYRGAVDATNLLAVVSKKQFITDGYEFTDDDQYGTYVCQADSPCYSTLTLNIPFQTTTTTTAAPTTTTTTSAATTTTTTTTAAPTTTTTTTTSAPGPTTTTTTTACQTNCEPYTCSYHGQGWFVVNYDGASQTATISAQYSDQFITAGGSQSGLTANSGTQYRDVSFYVNNGYFTNSGTVITCSVAIDTTYTTTTSTTTTTSSTTTTTTTSTTTTTTTTAAPVTCYNYEVGNDGGDTVVFSYTACNGSSASVTIPSGFPTQTICAQVNTVTMSPNSGTIGSPSNTCT
jgi:hypothetical protein